jgi:folate-binding protein YgfZ
MPALASLPVALAGKHRLLVRHDFAGVFGVELYIDTADVADCWKRLLEIGHPVGLRPVGWQTVNVLRIEAGIPRYGHDIDEDILPAETHQVDRAVSYTKGCYLGQEVVERMRSHNVIANHLVGLRFTGQAIADILNPVAAFGASYPGALTPAGRSAIGAVAAGLSAGRSVDGAAGAQERSAPLVLKAGQTDVGRVTSVCESPAAKGWIGLGYARSANSTPGTRLTTATEPPIEAEVVPLPFR